MKDIMDRHLGRFFSYGTNHKHAPLSFRETLYLSPEQVAYVLPQIKAQHHLPELAILSTCNRLEIYGVCPHNDEENAHLFLEIFRDLQVLAKKKETLSQEHLKNHTFCHRGKDAIKHVFDVAASVDSLIVGETQITGQFKEAFDLAQRASTLGPHLFQLSQNALRVAKKVRSETVIGRKTVSIGHAAIDLSRKIFSNLAEKNLLLLGAGDMAHVTGLYAKKVGIKDIAIVNRSLKRAQELSGVLGCGRVGVLSELESFLRQADIVITALSSDKPVITTSLLKNLLSKRKDKPMYIVDIAIPRNVDSACADFENVYLFELDDLQHYIDKNLSERELAVREAQQIIEHSLEKFCYKIKNHSESFLIERFHRYVVELIKKEHSKSFSRKELRSLSFEQKIAVNRMLESVSDKLTSDFAIAVRKIDVQNKTHMTSIVHEITKTHFKLDS